ncbi:CGNR zinc finger domain-containing protein [Demequina lignilytica]|uniref:CGNR zinc finger domain-containing protein n=1 Tax=Demequina lignilytica TaxID=3051663 RepID=A0AAW7M567_9MICO|nr:MULTISPECIES: CGNR zinc finger domain-containing protein [unclassified Demequina]MDN4477667.1 CGNR zinc finger domain-containing protein [Demequina sp. SYSU T00039-1]MDN4482938.1 CGNR zinc finger domain-containing protein [Demequina sp. SYSU T0a273]MDN4487982.1 CGNR zinc finger domain-containing protein [Demequina sp. SYSU T00039]MDN4490422.1 CGNR zinc finger domain-containing protein [Demequina sp. SYSU T00068]
MTFANDTAEALESGVFLSNSELEPDTLTTLDDLLEFFERFEYTGRRPTAADLEPVRAIRTPLRELFLASRDQAVPLVNRILAEQHAVPRLVRHGDIDWHIHATDEQGPFHARILVETAMAMIDVIRGHETQRFSRCAMEDCEGVVLDLSRNRSRKYCTVTCTNRAAQAAFRARQD